MANPVPLWNGSRSPESAGPWFVRVLGPLRASPCSLLRRLASDSPIIWPKPPSHETVYWNWVLASRWAMSMGTGASMSISAASKATMSSIETSATGVLKTSRPERVSLVRISIRRDATSPTSTATAIWTCWSIAWVVARVPFTTTAGAVSPKSRWVFFGTPAPLQWLWPMSMATATSTCTSPTTVSTPSMTRPRVGGLFSAVSPTAAR